MSDFYERRGKRTKEETEALLEARRQRLGEGHHFDYPFEDIKDVPAAKLISPEKLKHRWINGGERELAFAVLKNTTTEYEADDAFTYESKHDEKTGRDITRRGYVKKDKDTNEETWVEHRGYAHTESSTQQYGPDNIEVWFSKTEWEEETARARNIAPYHVLAVDREIKGTDGTKGTPKQHRKIIGLVEEKHDGCHYMVFVPTEYQMPSKVVNKPIKTTLMAEGIATSATEAMKRTSVYIENLKDIPLDRANNHNFIEGYELRLRAPVASLVIREANKTSSKHLPKGVREERKKFAKDMSRLSKRLEDMQTISKKTALTNHRRKAEPSAR